jgi:hypothetical protein
VLADASEDLLLVGDVAVREHDQVARRCRVLVVLVAQLVLREPEERLQRTELKNRGEAATAD